VKPKVNEKDVVQAGRQSPKHQEHAKVKVKDPLQTTNFSVMTID